ncbi:hypothetical protein [Bdellovibrio sp. NC01]|uniref:hypothetical protein n=1 Tax=Bdellovibrio sp. NC01 TaxID=2220073 RepID=UPI001157E5FF|nr:hypothetical protein [Bdellovibrio sp. NC01]QDK36498.1 hypothetical protein DOE51_02245 [Bdellovibrio sp. NC01]
MKQLLVLAALSMAAAPAMASKARLNSLGNAAHLIDTQTIFVNPADMNYTGDFATLEFGSTNGTTYSWDGTSVVTNTSPKAEGGFVRTTSFGKVGAYLGHRNDTTTSFIDGVNQAALASAAHTNVLLTEQNPLDLFYGTDFSGMKFGAEVHYSNSKNETATFTQKQNTLGLSAGLRTDVWNAYARVGLMGKTENDLAGVGAPELEAKGLYKVGGGYWFDSIYAFANYEYAKGTASSTLTGDNDISKNAWEIGMVNNHKVEGGNFFYGISYLSNEVKQEPASGSVKTTQSGLPLVVGMELDAASWLTLRGSVKQTVIVGENKNESANTKSNLTNDTVVAAGAGLKWGKIELDGSLAGSTSGDVNGNTLLADVALTYNF